MSKQIEAKFDKKAKDVLADTLGLGSLIEVSVNSRITLNGNKLLQLLIAKGVDVDSEIPIADVSNPYTGILLGCTLRLGSFLYSNVYPHMLYPFYKGSDICVKWKVDEYKYEVKKIGEQTVEPSRLTYKTMLQALGPITINNVYGTNLVPYLANKTSSQSMSQPVNITTSEFLSFITITPITE